MNKRVLSLLLLSCVSATIIHSADRKKGKMERSRRHSTSDEAIKTAIDNGQPDTLKQLARDGKSVGDHLGRAIRRFSQANAASIVVLHLVASHAPKNEVDGAVREAQKHTDDRAQKDRNRAIVLHLQRGSRKSSE